MGWCSCCGISAPTTIANSNGINRSGRKSSLLNCNQGDGHVGRTIVDIGSSSCSTNDRPRRTANLPIRAQDIHEGGHSHALGDGTFCSAEFIRGFFMETFANPSPQRNNVLFYHASIGIVIFTLALFRLGWRLTHQPPPLPQSISKPQQTAAQSLHWVMYLLILVQPISGYVHRMAGAHPVSFFGLFNLPVLISKNEPLRLLTDAIHDSGGIIIAILVAGHIGMALKHRFIDRDAVMQRMTP